ncbi:transcriptional regulator, TetR family [Paenibacillus sp. yr247]|uniref:TetR/AcrR family transcriptional regulator n=1 Tax=Paenibacillus sp. yr247 TaxID=1761880 RepID=UPI0008904F9D|nr:TetR/AcrR family transcriptional regulator [Paenibacillus sp. yr247]SDN53386.1 transcriptional regulator, TetR family [Paenibacillus sp. yr247]
MVSKKQKVIETGMRLFLEQGISQTNMEQIAEQTPVSKMTIYNYFQNKEGLVEQVVDKLIAEGHRLFREVMDQAKEPIEALSLFTKMGDTFAKNITDIFVTDLRDSFPHLMQRILDFNQDKIIPEFEMLIFKGQQLGQIRKDISPHILIMYLTFMKEFSMKSNLMAGAGSLTNVREQLTTILYHGIISSDYAHKI